MMTLSNDIPLLDAKLLGDRAELLLTDCASSLSATPTLRQYNGCNVLVEKLGKSIKSVSQSGNHSADSSPIKKPFRLVVGVQL